MSGIYVNSIKDKTNTRELASDSGSAWSWGSGVPSGTPLQVVQSLKTDTTSRANSNTSIDFEDIVGMTCNITPKTGNKVLVHVWMSVGSQNGYMSHARLVRGTTPIAVNTETGDSRPEATFQWRGGEDTDSQNRACSFLDESPGGDGSTAITYKMQWDGENGATMYLNRTHTEVDAYRWSRNASGILLMEIAG